MSVVTMVAQKAAYLAATKVLRLADYWDSSLVYNSGLQLVATMETWKADCSEFYSVALLDYQMVASKAAQLADTMADLTVE